MPTRAIRPAILLLLLGPAMASAQADDVDAFVKQQVAGRQIPGLSLGVVRGGEVVLARGYGMANVELAPATPETVYELASVSKQFTASAVMLLVEDGKLALDDPISDRLPGLPKAWDAIAVRNLLNHTSGIKDYLNTPHLSLRKDYACDELIKMVADLPLDFPPGEKWAYSNTNYVLLGMLVERAGGTTLAEFLAARVFGPLGMGSSRVNDTLAIIPNRATGYERDGGTLRIRDFISPSLASTGDGEVVSSVLDLARWDAALDSEKLLRRSTLRQMWTPATLKDGTQAGYGFGWAIGEQGGHKVVEHTGGFPGFNAHIARYEDDRLTVIVLANIASADAGRIARGVAAKYIPALDVPAPAPVEDKDPKTTEALKAVLVAMLEGKPAPDAFTAEAREVEFPKKVAELGKRLAPLGPLRTFSPLGEKAEGRLRSLRYRAMLGETTLVLTFALDDDGKIAGLLVRPE